MNIPHQQGKTGVSPSKPDLALAARPRSFVTLDALRGIAAIPVMYSHTARAYGTLLVFPHAHMAVDFFLLLSGFVMTYVYQQRLDAGWRTRDFLQVRVLRLYPLYFLGLLLGAAFLVLQNRYGKVHRPLDLLLELFVLGLFFLPTPPMPLLPRAPLAMYPYNSPAWSLFFEIVANLFHALFMRRRSLRILIGFCVVMAITQFFEAMRWNGFDIGFSRQDYLLGMGRMLLSYPLGVVLYRLWEKGRGRMYAPPWLIGLVLAALLAVPNFRQNGLFEWVTVVAIFPLLLWFGANSQPTPKLVRPARWLGALSYPLYILHAPLFAFFEQIWTHLSHRPMEVAAPWPGLLFLVLVIPLTFWIGENYDPEARKLLRARLPVPGAKNGNQR
jgi:peptidoglycan/LPS O-acetylase OafA/YrhL